MISIMNAIRRDKRLEHKNDSSQVSRDAFTSSDIKIKNRTSVKDRQMPHDHPVTQLINTTYNLKQL